MFDGHSGVDAADFSAANLICNIVRHKQFPTDIESAMKDGFIQTDTDFCTKAVVEVCGVVVCAVGANKVHGLVGACVCAGVVCGCA